jgi:uncharacterized protein (TIGR02118 family)
MRHTVYVLRRRSDLTREAFQKYWREVHGPLVASHAELLGIIRYVQMHTPDSARSSDELRGLMAEPFDGVAELWSEESRRTGSEEVRQAAVRALAEDERNFIDFARSSKWISEDHVFVGGAG